MKRERYEGARKLYEIVKGGAISDGAWNSFVNIAKAADTWFDLYDASIAREDAAFRAGVEAGWKWLMAEWRDGRLMGTFEDSAQGLVRPITEIEGGAHVIADPASISREPK